MNNWPWSEALQYCDIEDLKSVEILDWFFAKLKVMISEDSKFNHWVSNVLSSVFLAVKCELCKY